MMPPGSLAITRWHAVAQMRWDLCLMWCLSERLRSIREGYAPLSELYQTRSELSDHVLPAPVHKTTCKRTVSGMTTSSLLRGHSHALSYGSDTLQSQVLALLESSDRWHDMRHKPLAHKGGYDVIAVRPINCSICTATQALAVPEVLGCSGARRLPWTQVLRNWVTDVAQMHISSCIALQSRCCCS